jgi:hypothetical protein
MNFYKYVKIRTNETAEISPVAKNMENPLQMALKMVTIQTQDLISQKLQNVQKALRNLEKSMDGQAMQLVYQIQKELDDVRMGMYYLRNMNE